MRKLLLVALATAALAGSGASGAANVTITITAVGFVPTAASIRVGDTVTWRNTDATVHKVRFERYTECTLDIQPAQSASCTFTRVGSFIFTDPTLSTTPRGTVDVTDASARTTVAASATAVTYGQTASIAGHLASNAVGEEVILQARSFDSTRFAVAARTTSGVGGKWSFSVKPKAQTIYRVQVGDFASKSVTLNVRQ